MTFKLQKKEGAVMLNIKELRVSEKCALMLQEEVTTSFGVCSTMPNYVDLITNPHTRLNLSDSGEVVVAVQPTVVLLNRKELRVSEKCVSILQEVMTVCVISRRHIMIYDILYNN